MKIIAFCLYGQNRSRAAAEFLREKGYSADYAGVKDVSKEELQRIADRYDVVVTLHDSVRVYLKEVDLKGKRHVELDVPWEPGMDMGVVGREIEKKMGV